MITLIVKVDTKPDRTFDFIDATKIARDKTLEEHYAYHCKGCSEYSINKSPNNENEVILIETYYNQEAIDFHKTTEHFLTWRKDVEDMMNSPRQVTRYESID